MQYYIRGYIYIIITTIKKYRENVKNISPSMRKRYNDYFMLIDLLQVVYVDGHFKKKNE